MPPLRTHHARTVGTQVGEGGYGTVYSGKFYKTDVAIKVGTASAYTSCFLFSKNKKVADLF